MPELLQSPEGTQLAPDPPLLKSPEGTQPAPGPPLKSPEGTQPAPDPPLKSPEGTQPVTDPGTPFQIAPLSKVEFSILEQSLREAGALNRVPAIAIDIRKRIIAQQRTQGPALYQFVVSPYKLKPVAGSGVVVDDLQQVAWCEYLDKMESTNALRYR